MSTRIISPFPIFFDLLGNPLEDGQIYIGRANFNPETAPIQVFWDAILSVPADQPIRTISGMPSRAGTASNFYVAEATYSIFVRDKNGVLVGSAPLQP